MKELLNERGIPLNTGCQKLDGIDNHSKIKSVVNCTAPNEKDQITEDCIGRISRDYNSRDYNNRDYNSRDYNNRDSNNRDSNSRDFTKGKYRNRNRYPSPRNCFICNKPNHIAAECNNQYCQRCGTWGHGMKMCDKE